MPHLKNPRLKGYKAEKRFVDTVVSMARLPARRTGGSWDNGTDAVVRFCQRDITAQVKALATEFENIYQYLGTQEILVIQGDYQEQLIVCRTKDWCRHLRLAQDAPQRPTFDRGCVLESSPSQDSPDSPPR